VGGLVNRPDLAAWVERSCAAQGVPVKVADGAALRAVAVLLGVSAGGPARRRESASTGTTAGPSEAPHRLDPLHVDVTGARGTGGDDCVIEQGGNDGGLPLQGQTRPLAC
jgi:hypothetical protein